MTTLRALLIVAVVCAVRLPSSAAPNSLGINIDGPSDYSPNRTFCDAMKSHRGWKTSWNGANATVDQWGNPTQDAECVVFHGIGSMHGTYRLSFTGQATISVAWDSWTVRNKVYDAASNTTTAELVLANSGSAGLLLRLNGTGGTVKNVKLMRPISPGASQSFHPDSTFTPQFRQALAKFSTIRFMDWTSTNGNPQVNWSDRPLPTSTQCLIDPVSDEDIGASWEYAVQLCNETGKDAWICVPCKATDDYVRQLATLWRDGSTVNGVHYPGLDPARALYVEYSNELWNTAYGFSQGQTNYTLAQSEHSIAGHPLASSYWAGGWQGAWQRIGNRGAEVSMIFRSVFGEAAMMTRVRPMLMTQQHDGQGTLSTALNFVYNYYGYANAGNPTPHPLPYLFYGAGGSAYYSPANSSTTLTLNTIWDSEMFNVANWHQPLRTDANLCAAFGLRRMAYEGGPSMDRDGSDPVKEQAWTDPRMTPEMLEHHRAWSQFGGDLLMYFALTGNFQWGFMSDVLQPEHPKMRAIDSLLVRDRDTLTHGYRVPDTIPCGAWSASSAGGVSAGGGSIVVNNRTWYSYTLRVPQSGVYAVTVHYTSSGSATLETAIDGETAGVTAIASTGGAEQTTQQYRDTLLAGLHSVRIRPLTAGFTAVKIAVALVEPVSVASAAGRARLSPAPSVTMLGPRLVRVAAPVPAVRVVDGMGRQVDAAAIRPTTDGASMADLSGLAPGVYLIGASTPAGANACRVLVR